jgi:hypothetical protein
MAEETTTVAEETKPPVVAEEPKPVPEETKPAPEEPVTPTEPEPEPMIPLSAQKAERRKRQEAEKEAAYWRGVAEGGGKKTEAAVPVTPDHTGPPVPPPKPAALKQESFETWEAYEAAQQKVNHEYQEKREEYIAAKVVYDLSQKDRAKAEQQTQQEKISTYRTRLDKAIELDPEIETIADNWNKPGKYQMPLSPAMQDTILESEVGPEVLRHLYNNKDVAIKIARLGPTAAIREMLKIETGIVEKSKITPRKVSGAPPPVTPVTPKGSVAADDDSRPAKDVIAEYRRASWQRGG